MNVVLTKESEILLKLLAKDLFGYEEQINFEGVDLKELYAEARAQTVIGIAFNSLPNSIKEIDEDAYCLWQQTAFAIMQKTLNNNLANVKLTELLNKNNIKHATIKGYASAHYYPKPSLRQMGDIDFLVDKSDVESASNVLLNNGFSYGHDANELHIGFNKNKMSYEMHTSVTTVPEGKEFVLNEFDDLISNSIEVNSICGKIIIPSKYHHGVVMLTHMQRHMMNGGGIGLRHLCDWAVFVNAIECDEWSNIFENKLKKIGLWKFAKAISKTATIYLKMPEKQWFSDVDTELASALIYDIFDGGNFGRKSTTRSTQRIMNESKSKNKVLRILDGTKSWIYKKYPFCKKHKITLPIFYVVHTFKVLFKTIFKGTDYKFSDVLKKGNEQFDTYSKLKFFQEEN